VLCCVFVAAPAAASARVPAVPRPTDRVVINVVKVNGSGCRSGSAAVAVSLDNTAFTVSYSGYLAQVGVGARKQDQLVNCSLRLKVGVPKGFTYTIDQTNYRGFAHLEPGATGREAAGYSFQGASATVHMNHAFTGPMDDDWQIDDAPLVAFEPCGKQRDLIIDTELAVDAGTSNQTTTTSMMAMDTADGTIKTTYRLAWKTC
jgi:hypothetical protein